MAYGTRPRNISSITGFANLGTNPMIPRYENFREGGADISLQPHEFQNRAVTRFPTVSRARLENPTLLVDSQTPSNQNRGWTNIYLALSSQNAVVQFTLSRVVSDSTDH